MSPSLEQAKKKTLALLKERPGAEHWAQNLVDGSACLESDEDWTNYYHFLANPTGVTKTDNHVVTSSGELDWSTFSTGQKITTYNNGPDQIIICENLLPVEDKYCDDEKN